MEIMWLAEACVSALLIIWLTHSVYRWRNPKCKGVLPPGSMGFPLIGETLELMIPSYSIDLNPFIKKRLQKYGTIFRTSVAGRNIVVSADPKFNHFIAQNEGKLVEHWYLDAFTELVGRDGMMNKGPVIHRYIRSTMLKQFGMEPIKEKLLSLLYELAQASLESWSLEESVDVKSATSKISFELFAERLLSYDSEVLTSKKQGEPYLSFFDDLMSFPLNIPGTTHYKCLQGRDKAVSRITDIFRRRKASTERSQRDCLDQLIEDMKKEDYINEGFIVQFLFVLLFVAFDSITVILTLILRLLEEHPRAIEELTDEHEAFLTRRQNPDSPITWDEYKSMHFTRQVIDEGLRLGNSTPGMFRKTKEDIQVNGYTIPAGWGLMLATSAVNLTSDMYEDPTLFNPWRWKDMKPQAIAKNFMPFGESTRQCPGANYARVFMSMFLHVLVTKYRWKSVKGGKVYRNPILKLQDMKMKFVAKENAETPLPC